MFENRGSGSQTGQCNWKVALTYTDAWRIAQQRLRTVVETRIKPYQQQVAEREARERQARAFRRNQFLGLVILAGVVCLWWLLHTNPKWIFPAGWWRW